MKTTQLNEKFIILTLTFLFLFLTCAAAQAATLTVTKTADSNDGVCDADCSLREAIAAANPGDTIVFASPLFDTAQTISLTNGELGIGKSLTITGKGADKLTISGNNATRVFNVSGSAVILEGFTIADGRGNSFAQLRGGGILNTGTLIVRRCHIKNNQAFSFSGEGGGIYNQGGTLTLDASTVSGNSAPSTGGGININGGTVNITNSTISGNGAGETNQGGGGIRTASAALTITNSTITNNSGSGAGGVFVFGGTATIGNSIIAGNQNNGNVPDVSGAFTSNGYNLIGNRGAVTNFNQPGDQTGTGASTLNPQLAALADNGGTTPTHALILGSPAIDTGNCAGCSLDQRGFSRPVDIPLVANTADGSDIGAYELVSPFAESLVVTTTVDEDNGTSDPSIGMGTSLREAVNFANLNADDSTISFNLPGAGPHVINLTTIGNASNGNSALMLSNNISIDNDDAGAEIVTVQRSMASGTPEFRIFTILDGEFFGFVVSISGLIIRNGQISGSLPEAGGGAIFNGFGGRLTVTGCTIAGNSAAGGGGIFNSNGTLTVVSSTVSSNFTTGEGGGILSNSESTGLITTIRNSTLSGNSAGVQGGGLYNFDGLTIVESSTITGNTAPTGKGGGVASFSDRFTRTELRNSIVAGNITTDLDFVEASANTFRSNGYNLIGDGNGAGVFVVTGDQTGVTDPKLGALADNGGRTQTHALLANSPAIDKGNTFGQTLDQRGSPRPFDVTTISNLADGADIGAYEVQIITTAASVTISGKVLNSEGRGLRGARVTLTDQNGNSRMVLTTSFGYYRFTEIEAGQTYILQVVSKRYSFAAQVISVTEEITDLDFTAASLIK